MANSVNPTLAVDLVRGAADLLRPRHTDADIALGAMAGLGLLRGVILEQAGYNAMRQLDDWLRAQLEERRAVRGQTTARGEPPALPEPGPGFHRAATIMKDAVYTCLFFHPHAPGNELLLAAAGSLVDLVVEGLGQVPSWAAVHEALGEGTADPGTDTPRPHGMILLQ